MKTKLCSAELKGLGNMQGNIVTRRAQQKIRQDEADAKSRKKHRKNGTEATEAVPTDQVVTDKKPRFCRRRS